jgi:hypothetical protein
MPTLSFGSIHNESKVSDVHTMPPFKKNYSKLNEPDCHSFLLLVEINFNPDLS